MATINVSVFITLFHNGLSENLHPAEMDLDFRAWSELFLIESTSVLQNRVESRNQLPRQWFSTQKISLLAELTDLISALLAPYSVSLLKVPLYRHGQGHQVSCPIRNSSLCLGLFQRHTEKTITISRDKETSASYFPLLVLGGWT